MTSRKRQLPSIACRSRNAVGALVLFAMAGPASAQDPPELVSGPGPGTPLPACPVYAPSGPLAGTEFDASKRLQKGPGVLLFVHDLSRNTAPMITGLDRLAVQLAWTGLETFTIRVAADRNEAEAAVKRSSDALSMYRPIVISPDGIDGPGGYALHRKATLTLVVAKDGVVVRSVAFTDTGRADLGRLRALVEEATGAIPTDAKALRALVEERLTRDPEQLRTLAIELTMLLQRVEQMNEARAQRNRTDMRADAKPAPAPAGAPGAATAKPREGKPPEDEELRALLRRAIQLAADTAELDAVYSEVETRVGTDAGLRTQSVEMFKLQLSLGYGNDDSKKRAKAYVEKHGAK
ncbi:MAG TPA: hypothetical protein VFD82_19470 [Planctomycetota bacterium]|nr:hypothetical protein [Planctomycetota bacterium]